MSDSSDDDSFHSASDGESHDDVEDVESTASLSTVKAESDVTESKDSAKDSSEDFEKIELMMKADDVVFKVPKQPAVRARTDAAKAETSSTSTKSVKAKSSRKFDEGDDGLQKLIDEYEAQSSAESGSQKPIEKKLSSGGSSESEDEKGTKKSIWHWKGIQDIVNAVGEGLSSAVEAGLKLPPAEEMARLSVAERRKLLEEVQHMKEPEPSLSSDEGGPGEQQHDLFRQKKSSASREQQHARMASAHSEAATAESGSGLGGFFSTGGLLSNFVSAPLDVLETLGKKTFETLTVKDESKEGDKRRFFLHGVHASEDQSLFQVLRELRDSDASAPSGQRLGREDRFNTSFVSLFERNEGMVHLEGLELLSRDQERRTKGQPENKVFNETLTEFCVEDVSECLTEDFENEFAKSVKFISLPFKPDDVLETNSSLTQELTLRQAAVDATEEVVVEAIHEAAITALAKLTAHSISALHKMAQLIIIAKQLPEVETLFAFTYLLCRRLSFFATQYTNILNVVETSEQVDEVVSNIFFECTNACHDVKKALQLLRPFFKGH